MKNCIVLCMLFLISGSLLAQPINWDSVRAAYVTKYQPQQMPAWLFPIIFEEGTGQRDTIYLGYDPNAQDLGWPLNDTVFGERYWPFDTSIFQSVWSSVVNDSAFKSVVRKTFNNSIDITFYKVTLPLTVYWDRTAFYDTALPFPDQNPAPVAEGLWTFDYPTTTYWDPSQPQGFCPFDSPIMMTDTMRQPGSACWHTDSIYFWDINGNPNGTPSLMAISIRGWTGQVLSVEEPEKTSINIYPNPFTDEISIEIDPTVEVDQIELIDIYGKYLKHLDNAKITHSLTGLPAGIYFIHIKTPSQSQILKLIKM